MLQIDHIYEFFKSTIFKGMSCYYFENGIIDNNNFRIFTDFNSRYKVLYYDQEPFLLPLAQKYLESCRSPEQYSTTEIHNLLTNGVMTAEMIAVGKSQASPLFGVDPKSLINKTHILITSELSLDTAYQNFHHLYYFFHGFAALDWYRGFYALNYSKRTAQEYRYDYVTFNRLITNDRSYRCYFVSKLAEHNLLSKGRVSFGVTAEHEQWHDELTNPHTKLSLHAIQHISTYLPTISTPLVIDSDSVHGWASADIPRVITDSFWHIVTETVFYYNKLHLTEKVFKPIVMKQPFMLLAAPGNLAYLRSYGFKTFDGIIDESYDSIQNHDERINAVTAQLNWYCNLPANEKQSVINAIAPIVEYNFKHFYSEFKHIITSELLDNCKMLFKEIGYDDNDIAYDDIYKALTK